MTHFSGCYTTEEIKARYRQEAMKLHPDKGGTDEAFRGLQEQYERALHFTSNMPLMPQLFNVSGIYEYHRARVTYVERDCHWYKFVKDNGVNVWVDYMHIYLIKTNC